MTDTIVVGYDGSEVSRTALEAATDLARAMGSEIMLACMLYQPSIVGFGASPPATAALAFLPGINWEKALQVVADELEAAATKVRAAGVTCASTCARGEPAESLVGVAKTVCARLIVIGTTGAGSSTGSLGSTARRLLETSNVPILMVPKQ